MAVISLLLVAGCSSQPPASLLAREVPPLREPGRLDRTFCDVAPESAVSLWEALTGERVKPAPARAAVRTRVRSVGPRAVWVTRLVDGVEVGSRTVNCSFDDNYLRVTRGHFMTVVLATVVGSEAVSAGLLPNGDLRLWQGGAGFILLTIIPMVPCSFPRWHTFHAEPATAARAAISRFDRLQRAPLPRDAARYWTVPGGRE